MKHLAIHPGARKRRKALSAHHILELEITACTTSAACDHSSGSEIDLLVMAGNGDSRLASFLLHA